jgi:hypothetical protein
MLLATSSAILYKRHKQKDQIVACFGNYLYVDAKSPNRITEVTVKHTGCYGPCPVYKISFKSNGEALYVGEEYVDKIGTFKGRIYEGSFLYLSRFIENEGFFAMKDWYPENCIVTDLEHTIVSVIRDGKRKSVDSMGGVGPIERWGIEEAIEGVAVQTKWERVSDAAATLDE